jgi:hypothetical protein
MDPVTAQLDSSIAFGSFACPTIIEGSCWLIKCVILLTLIPSDIEKLRLLLALCISRHFMLVSEAQVVLEQEDCVTRDTNVPALIPKFADTIVILDAPVAAMLTDLALLNATRSQDMASLTDPIRWPELTVIFRDELTIWLGLQLKVVSDAQSVASHTECNVSDIKEKPEYPKWSPVTVMLREPVVAVLKDTTESTGVANERTELELPILTLKETNRRKEDSIDWETKQNKEVSEPQRDDSQSELPMPLLPVTDVGPIPAPCKVTLTEPVSGALARSIPLNPPPSIENTSDTLPGAKPAVTAAIRVAHSPDPGLQRNDVSDCHSEASQLLTPCLLTAV